MDVIDSISRISGIARHQVGAVLDMLDEGNTIPFIARYRKERTGMLDEEQIQLIRDEKLRIDKLEERRSAILESMQERQLLTGALEQAIRGAQNLTDLEDIYLPYRPKKKTRASMARELGLEPLAKMLMSQGHQDPQKLAGSFVKKDVADSSAALQGARDIIAEWIAENPELRKSLRMRFEKFAEFQSKLVKTKEEEAQKYRDYFDYHEPASRMPSHRFMAVMRGHKEGFLRISVEPDEERSLQNIDRMYLKNQGDCAQEVKKASRDAYKRLIVPSLENELLQTLEEKAAQSAVRIFAANLRQLLMAAPLGEKRILGIDPGFRTGCKLVCLDAQGKLLHNETIYPHQPQQQDKQAMAKLSQLIETYKIDAVAIGNGTAGRETENLITRMRLPAHVKVFVVSESGASIYSASKTAREEFPQYDITVRGAVSIGRRLQDPLAELVKIEPSAVGVGQYQHDIDANLMNDQLADVVRSCVNQVGVNLNTASVHLLSYVSGLSTATAAKIVEQRNQVGAFTSRNDLFNIPRLGKKTYEQCAGFLRIPEAQHPLDNSAVHPERYGLVEKMAKDAGIPLKDLIGRKDLKSLIDPNKYVSQEIGLPTLNDILAELEKPGRDPRKNATILEFDPNVRKPDDLIPGMVLPGIITNITAFGAFVDVGVKQDGLVHISQLADQFVSDPLQVVKLHQHVKVKVMEVDLQRKRIALAMKGVPQ
jgi:protein Tex